MIFLILIKSFRGQKNKKISCQIKDRKPHCPGFCHPFKTETLFWHGFCFHVHEKYWKFVQWHWLGNYLWLFHKLLVQHCYWTPEVKLLKSILTLIITSSLCWKRRTDFKYINMNEKLPCKTKYAKWIQYLQPSPKWQVTLIPTIYYNVKFQLYGDVNVISEKHAVPIL